MRIRQIALLVLSQVLLLNIPQILHAHGVAKVVMYPAAKIYEEKGLKIPELGDDLVAIIGDKKFKKSDYKQWLYRKIGFRPEIREEFIVNKYLTAEMKKREVDPAKVEKLFLDNIYQFIAFDKLYTNYADWLKDAERITSGEYRPNKRGLENIEYMMQRFFLITLYVQTYWDEIHESIFKQFEIKKDFYKVAGENEQLNQLIALNNFYYKVTRYISYIDRDLYRVIYGLGVDTLLDSKEEYIEWLFEKKQSALYTENHLSMYLVEEEAKKKGVTVTDEAVEELYEERLSEYRLTLQNYLQSYIDLNVSIEPEPLYLEYMKKECRTDLLGSRQYRKENPLKSYEMVKRYYDKYGYKGERCQVSEIFKWVRKKVRRDASPEFEAYAKKEEAFVWGRLGTLRAQILEEGVETFPEHAIVENDNTGLQLSCGYLEDLDEDLGKELLEDIEKLKLHEISPILKSSSRMLNIVWLGEIDGDERKYYVISKRTPGRSTFDVVNYVKELEMDRKALEGLKKQIEAGASLDKLAEEHSDSYRKFGSDVSDKYQNKYGLKFAKELYDIKEGEMKIISSEKGLHLVHLKKKTRTPYDDKVKNEIIHEYNFKLATNEELNALSKVLLYKVDPYFE